MWSKGKWGGGVEGWTAPVAASGGGPATTWNPSDKNSNITLSGSNLVYTVGTAADGYVRSVAATSTQKIYFEVVATTLAVNAGIGVAASSANLAAQLAGASVAGNTAAGVLSNAYYWDFDGPDSGWALSAVISAGDNIGVAFDPVAKKIWFRQNNGAWNAALSTQDPAAGTGGLSVHFSGPYFALSGGGGTGDAGTAKFASTDWTYAAPSGFAQLS